MTQQKKLKQRVRDRMARTGERYAAARRHVIADAPAAHQQPQAFVHFPGSIPGAASLRIALANAGLVAPHTRKPFSEAMVFGISGGIGAGVFSFRYDKEDVSTFYISGRHLLQDDLAFIQNSLDRLSCEYQVFETGSAKKAAGNLEQALDAHGPCLVWVDMAHLPYRRMPEFWSGGGYHLLVVYRLDDGGSALVGDLADQPLTLSTDALAEARARIKKQKNRVLAITKTNEAPDLKTLILAGMRATIDSLENPRQSSFSLQAFGKWADDLKSDGKDGWRQKFRAGPNLWRGLTSIYDFIEHYNSGGGLMRPMYAEFLRESSDALGEPSLLELAQTYVDLGSRWTAVAEAALPSDIPEMAEAKDLFDLKAEQFLSSGADSADTAETAWARLQALEMEAGKSFPLDSDAVGSLLMNLSDLVEGAYMAEIEAFSSLKTMYSKLAESA